MSELAIDLSWKRGSEAVTPRRLLQRPQHPLQRQL